MKRETDILYFLNVNLKKHGDYQTGMRFTQCNCRNGIFSFSYEGSDNNKIFSEVVNETFHLSLLPVT
ncbi:hypothetical protein ACWONS_004823 [Vibrio parahaemolyticus]